MRTPIGGDGIGVRKIAVHGKLQPEIPILVQQQVFIESATEFKQASVEQRRAHLYIVSAQKFESGVWLIEFAEHLVLTVEHPRSTVGHAAFAVDRGPDQRLHVCGIEIVIVIEKNQPFTDGMIEPVICRFGSVQGAIGGNHSQWNGTAAVVEWQ